MAAGRVGRAHGLDGSFYVEGAPTRLALGSTVDVDGEQRILERWDGTAERPLARLSGVADRSGAAALRGAELLVAEAEAPLEAGEWLAADLVGCRVIGLGEVLRVVNAPSCDLLEVGEDRLLVPLVADALRRVDPAAREIEVDHAFLGTVAIEGR